MADDVRVEVELKTSGCTGIMRERLYWLQHGLSDYPTCSTCGFKLSSKNFRTNSQGGRYTETCSVKCAKRNVIFSERVKQTNRAKYGSEYYLGSETARKSIEHTNLQKYGTTVPHPWESQQFKKLIAEKYGAEHYMQSDAGRSNYKRKIIESNIITGRTEASISACEAKRTVTCINPEAALDVNREELETIELSWRHRLCGETYTSPIVNGKISQCPHCRAGTSILELSLRNMVMEILPDEEILFNVRDVCPGNIELDIYIPGRQLAIEFNGIYWHNVMINDDKFRHRKKSEACNRLGIRLLHVWEDHFLQKPDIIRSIIKNACGQSKKIGARNCDVVELQAAEANKFLTENHLNGYIRCSNNYGLVHNKKIVAVMSFGAKRFGARGDNCWELYRFASKTGLQISGGASKLFKHFINSINPEQVVSFADLSLGGGDVYLNIGMAEDTTTAPSYFWANTASPSRLSRFKTQKHKLPELIGDRFDQSLTEEENMKKIGWFKLWDCGHRRFVYQK